MVKYTGNGSGSTVAHGLNASPELILFKRLNHGTDWIIYNNNLKSNGYDGYLSLNNTYGEQNAGVQHFNNTNPTSSVFSVGTDNTTNNSGSPYIAYCFHSVESYQDINEYTGSGATGKTVTTGFLPRFLVIKRVDATDRWLVADTSRHAAANNDLFLDFSSTDAETSFGVTNGVSFTSTGFTINSTDGGVNASSGKYFYWAIA